MSFLSSPQRRIVLREGDEERRRLERLADQGDAVAAAKLRSMAERMSPPPPGPNFNHIKFKNVSFTMPISYYDTPGRQILFIRRGGWGTFFFPPRRPQDRTLANDPVTELLVAADYVPKDFLFDGTSLVNYYPGRRNKFHYLVKVSVPPRPGVMEHPPLNVVLRWGDTHSVWENHNRDNPAAIYLFDYVRDNQINTLNITAISRVYGNPPVQPRQTQSESREVNCYLWLLGETTLPAPHSGSFLPASPAEVLPPNQWTPPRVSWDLMLSGKYPFVHLPEGVVENQRIRSILEKVLTPQGLADINAWEDLVASCGLRAKLFIMDRHGERYEVKDVLMDYGGETGRLLVRHIGPKGDMQVDIHKAHGYFLPVVVYKPIR